MVREAASFGYRRSARRPLDLTPEEVAALKQDPEYKHYERRVQMTAPGTSEYLQARRELSATLKRLRYAATKKLIGKDWTEKQAVDDIVNQIEGGPANDTTRRRVPRPMNPAQQAMLDALYQPMTTTLQGQLQRRTNAVQAVAAYCAVQEPPANKILEKAYKPAARAPKLSTAEERAAKVVRLRKMATVAYEDQKLRMCFICVAQAIQLPPSDPNVTRLCHEFSQSSSLRRHFASCHLQFFDPSARPDPCPLCTPKVRFKNIAQFRSHAQVVQGVIIPQPEKPS